MEIILMRDMRHAGKRGDVINVKAGYARNYLFPRGYALEATDGNKRYFEEQRQKIDQAHVQEVDTAKAAAAELEKLKLEIRKRVGDSETLYGSVTAKEVAILLAEKGVEFDRRRIDLDGGIKTLGEHKIRLEVHPEVVAEIPLTVVAAE